MVVCSRYWGNNVPFGRPHGVKRAQNHGVKHGPIYCQYGCNQVGWERENQERVRGI